MSKFDLSKVDEIEKFLATNAYLSGSALPNAEDSKIMLAIKDIPSVADTPNLYYWYASLS